MELVKISSSGILFKCPLDNEKSDCPFIGIRKMTPYDRVEHYIEMDENKFKKAIEFHGRCLYENKK